MDETVTTAPAADEPKKTHKERLKEITDSIEAGIKDLFDSEKYKNYLRTMSKFHNYSFNNTMLIHMQMPEATHVASFSKWKDKFHRNVKRGEHGIRIIAPTPCVKKVEEIKRDPETNAPMVDQNGEVIMEEKQIKIPRFKVVTVFDVSQTYGEPLPQLASDLTGDVQQFEIFMEALKRSAPVPLEVQPLAPDLDGYFSPSEQRIVIREGMSEVQTICAAVHEIAHSILHNKEAMAEDKKSHRTQEVEAESIAFSVCAYYGIETDENSFGYIAAWSSGQALKELKASLETINRTAGGLINDIDRNFNLICKEREAGFLAHPGSFAIYQMDHSMDSISLRFSSYDELAERDMAPKRDMYNLIYTAELGDKSLDDIYYEFNEARPADYKSYSLSVSDIIALNQGGAVSYHYVDRFGFKELPDFAKDNPLKNAEMSVEDDYNMVDGIINNGPKLPTVAELEERSKQEPISLMDLHDAIVREKNVSENKSEVMEKHPSVLAMLQKPVPGQDGYKNTAPGKGAEMEL